MNRFLPRQLNARVMITLVTTVAVVSVVLTVLQFSSASEVSKLARDSYGTRSFGYRAFYEILGELSFHSQRTVAHPASENETEKTVVLLQPKPRILNSELAFVNELKEWIESGGHLLYCPSVYRGSRNGKLVIRPPRAEAFLPLLGIEGVGYRQMRFGDMENGDDSDPPETMVEKISVELARLLEDDQRPRLTLSSRCSGNLEYLDDSISRVQVYKDEWLAVEAPDDLVDGKITVMENDSDRLDRLTGDLVVSIPLGNGMVTVVASPCIAENRLIDQEDNAVLMVQLAGSKSVVEFDEFFHGHYVQGNILYLLTQPVYTMVLLLLLLLCGLWINRQARFLGPPLDPPSSSRRTITEYISAMARLLGSGRDSLEFLVRELRAGLLATLADELEMPGLKSKPELLIATLERTRPEMAGRYRQLLGKMDRLLGQPTQINRKTVTSVVKEFRVVFETKL